MENAPAVRVEGLEKDYGEVRALKGIDLTIPEGSFFGLLGPNGAGKTTFINILVGLVSKTGGSASVYGHDVEEDYRTVRDAIGLAPQENDLDRFFSIREVLINKAGYHGVPRKEAAERADRLLEKFGIADKKDERVNHLSGGMKRRMLLARSLMNDPDLLILDEPTAGVDVELRRSLWDVMREMNDDGRTILLTTHYIEEAEELCEEVAIMDKGRVLDVDSPENFVDRGRDTITLTLTDAPDTVETGVDGVEEEYSNGVLTVKTRHGVQIVPTLIERLQEQGIEIESVQTDRSSLEDIFVDMTEGSDGS